MTLGGPRYSVRSRRRSDQGPIAGATWPEAGCVAVMERPLLILDTATDERLVALARAR